MDTVELTNSINSFRKGNREYISNAFLSAQQLDDLLCKSDVCLKQSDDAILILLNKSEFYQGYFFARNLCSFITLIEKLDFSTKALLLDIIGKEKDVLATIKQLEMCGVKLYSVYIRMACNKICKFQESKSATILASKQEGPLIYNLLYDEFDHFDAHLPTLEDIDQSIKKSEITVIKSNDLIIGLAIFEWLGSRSLYLRELMVSKEFRGKGIADALLQHTLNQINDDVKVTLWVMRTNLPAIKRYKKYGFAEDGLIDYIMLYKGKDQ